MTIEEIKEQLTIEQIYELVNDLGAKPRKEGNVLICRTICHNNCGCGSHKLYYYDNTKLFHCFTDCSESFDIVDLVKRNKTIETLQEWGVSKSTYFVASYFGFDIDNKKENSEINIIEDWTKLKKYDKILNEGNKKKIIELNNFNKDIIKYLPRPEIIPWSNEGITLQIQNHNNICYDPVNGGIIIPHYDINNNLVGIRTRTLVKDLEQYGKYKPAILGGKMYNHPLSFNLYNINNSKDNISKIKKAFIFESEKSCMLYQSYFGIRNDISVACCGSAIIQNQIQLLLSLGVNEIIISLDKQFKEIGDKEWEKLTKNFYNIHNKYGKIVQISYLFDKENLLEYKMSPIDNGKDIFLKLFEERIML